MKSISITRAGIEMRERRVVQLIAQRRQKLVICHSHIPITMTKYIFSSSGTFSALFIVLSMMHLFHILFGLLPSIFTTTWYLRFRFLIEISLNKLLCLLERLVHAYYSFSEQISPPIVLFICLFNRL